MRSPQWKSVSSGRRKRTLLEYLKTFTPDHVLADAVEKVLAERDSTQLGAAEVGPQTREIRVDRKLWTGRTLSRLIVYAVEVAHLVLAAEPVAEYERTALFREKARVSLDDGQYLVELPRRVYDFYHLDEADYTVMASEIKPKTIEILL